MTVEQPDDSIQVLIERAQEIGVNIFSFVLSRQEGKKVTKRVRGTEASGVCLSSRWMKTTEPFSWKLNLS